MADPTAVPIPQGATIGSVPIPEGATIGDEQSTSGQPAAPQAPFLERMGQGIASGAAETVAGLGKIGSHIPGVNYASEKLGDALGLPKLGPDQNPYDTVEKSVQHNKEQATNNTAGRIGYGGETLTEFFLGDEALKGLSLADKLKAASGVAQVFEKSPKLMKAVQIGADAMKNYPKATEIVGEAMRQGAVQGTQTLAKTGGDVGEAAKEGATMAGTSGVLGAVGAGAGSLLEKGGKAAQTVETLGKVAEAAPSKEEVTEGAKNAVDSAKQSMHTKFEAGIQDLTERLGDKEVPHADSPIAATAKELIKAPEPAEHGLVAAAKEAAGERIDKPVKALLDKAAAQEGQAWKVNDLVDFRQAVRKLADSYPPGDPNARTLYKLLPSVDDTLGKLADQSGDTAAKSDYEALRKDYKDKIKYFTPSGKPEDRIAYATANVLRTGTKEDIGKYLMSGDARAKVKALTGLLGDDGAKQIGKTVFSNMVEDAGANPANLVKSWTKLPEEARNSLFDTTVGEKAINDLMTDTQSAARIQQLMRATVAGGVGGSLGALSHSGLGTLLGLAIGEGGGGFASGRKVLDYVANHPAVWKSLGLAGKAAKAAESGTGQALGTVIKQQAGRGLSSVMQGASQPLSEPAPQSGEEQ